ncbi:hypothetical protein UP09_06670 [Bradyrhizobium sp. LTSP885]|uniref:hypothetical protein n=1 Tax=Bradyrhizobium sp. LTSP885 TaxID=1619232 RepID=UPI0005C83224|nr:hypothetical protein [Bradyrhizobium sp. LTSP885]KJC49396.1 hypothetical protein UP09_06670 [Bradyrhizobium sp. LTSP885]
MRKALFGLVLTAVFVSAPLAISPARAQNAPQGQSGGDLNGARSELKDIDDVIVIIEKKVKAAKEAPAERKPSAGPPAPEADQQMETLKILREQLRAKIELAEKARNPAEVQVLAKDARLQAEAARSVKQSVAGVPQGPSGVVDRAIMQKFGSQALEQARAIDRGFKTNGNTDGAGAPSAHTIYDVARPRADAAPDPVAPPPDRIMHGNVPSPSTGTASAGATVSGHFKPTTVDSAHEAVQKYGSQFGGVVLEGDAVSLPPIQKVTYNRLANAMVVNDRAVYFAPVPARALATLARTIADEENIGVSLGSVHVVTKALPPESEIALDLKIADHFLGDIVFARNDWTRGYLLGFDPQKPTGESFNVAVYFKFDGFEFTIDRDELRGTQAGLDISLVPLSDKKAADGGMLPDEDAIRRGVGSPQYEANARHIADDVDHYRREKIIARVFAYGQVAALLRGMKRSGRDLTALARAIETENGFTVTDEQRSPEVTADAQASAPAPATAANPPGTWEFIGSALSLQQTGAQIRFLYQQPRPGMLEAGAQPGSLLFEGQHSETQIWGTAYMFSRTCGPQAYPVQGQIVDGGTTVVMRGEAPWVYPTTCEPAGTHPVELVLKATAAAPRREVVLMVNHWVAYLKSIQERNEYPNWPTPPYDLYRSRLSARG